MQPLTIVVCLALLSHVQAHHHCCACCTGGSNTCSLSGTPDMCTEPNGVLAMCNKAAYQNPKLFFRGCYGDDGKLLQILLAEDNKVVGQSMKQSNWLSKPISRGEGVMMMFFVFSALAMGLGYVKLRSHRVVIDSPPLLA